MSQRTLSITASLMEVSMKYRVELTADQGKLYTVQIRVSNKRYIFCSKSQDTSSTCHIQVPRKP